MNNLFEDPSDLDRDVVDLLAKAGPLPKEDEEVAPLLFSPRKGEIQRAVWEWIQQWRAGLDNSYYFRSDVADEIFEFGDVKCSIVKNAQWMEALETRNWSKHEVYGYNGYALFKQAPYLHDGMTGSLEEELLFAREIDVYGGVDLTHLDEHGWLCSFIASHDWDRDNPGRTDRVWIKEQIIKMVVSVKKLIPTPRSPVAEPAGAEIGDQSDQQMRRIGPMEAFSFPCNWTDEISGYLGRAVLLYLQGQQLSTGEIGVLRSYFRQWIQSRVWDMNTHTTIESRRMLGMLRHSVGNIRSPREISRWLEDARSLGLNPLR
jgi:hypothetical protein